eukprot:5887150-Prorocentrum_lima.AAC.1
MLIIYRLESDNINSYVVYNHIIIAFCDDECITATTGGTEIPRRLPRYCRSRPQALRGNR